MESRWEVPDGFWTLNWFDEGNVPKKLLSFSRQSQFIQACLREKVHHPIHQMLLGKSPIGEEAGLQESIEDAVWSAVAAVESGVLLDVARLAQLEQRSAEVDSVLHIEAAKVHVQCSMAREIQARQRLSEKSLPFVFPGEILPIHIELFAGGEKALHVLHVELLQKLGVILVDAIEIDCQYRGTWLLSLIEVLPEKKLKRKIQALSTSPTRKQQRVFTGGGWGLLAAYAQRIGLDPIEIVERGNEMDRLFWITLSEHLHHTVG